MSAKDKDTVDEKGRRKDAELFEEGLVDGAWIPLGFAFDSPTEITRRARELEESAPKEKEET